MPVIRPMSDLVNHPNEIAEICHSENQPIFITYNGRGDLVVMSQVYYDRLQNLLELYQKLSEAEKLDAAGESGILHEEMMNRLRERMHA